MHIPHFTQLGGTLFISATHKSLEAILLENKYPDLKSLVIDTEDGLNASELECSLGIIEKLLPKLQKTALHIFLRPKNSDVLKLFLCMSSIETIDGFVLPKFSLENAREYLDLIKNSQHSIMPSIEGIELFDANKLHSLRDTLLEYKERIVLVRFGLEDMLGQLGLRRSCEDSVFDLSAPHVVLGNFISTFKSVGFAISGGVYPCYKDKEGFIRDSKRDLKEGLFTKTIIHPSQIAPLNELYKVTQEELFEAQSIVKSSEAVFALNGKMAEKNTMEPYALDILKRYEAYGSK